jgi:hypothetical protein
VPIRKPSFDFRGDPSLTTATGKVRSLLLDPVISHPIADHGAPAVFMREGEEHAQEHKAH